jgi:hypothetical protein
MLSIFRGHHHCSQRRKRLVLASAAVLPGLTIIASPGKALALIIYDNAQSMGSLLAPYGVVSNPGGGSGGFDLSAYPSPEVYAGFSPNLAFNFSLLDDFTVPTGQIWNLTGANLLGYTTNETTVTLSGARVRIFRGDPRSGGYVAFGNLADNVQVSASLLNIYRANSASPSNTQRRLQLSTTSFQTSLASGQYWLEYSLTSSTGAVFSPPLTPSGAAASTGNALQFDSSTSTYSNLVDGGNAKGIPFQLTGTVQSVPGPVPALGAAVFFGYARKLRRRRK